jgi:hypothetical protein
MTELVRAEDAHTTVLTEQMDYARAVSSASMLPDNYRGKPADILLAVGLGSSMGLSPAESLYRISVIKGKPTASAELIAANVRKAGHKLRVATDEPASASRPPSSAPTTRTSRSRWSATWRGRSRWASTRTTTTASSRSPCSSGGPSPPWHGSPALRRCTASPTRRRDDRQPRAAALRPRLRPQPRADAEVPTSRNPGPTHDPPPLPTARLPSDAEVLDDALPIDGMLGRHRAVAG